MAIQAASASETLRVRLLSIAQARQAPSTASRGQRRAEARLARPGQHRRTGDDGRHAERDAAIEVLAEHEPGEQRREYAPRR